MTPFFLAEVPQVVQRVKERSAALAEARNTSIDHGPSYLESWIESAIGIVSEGFRFEDYVGLDWIIVAAWVLASCLMVFGFINVFALFAVWLERKVSAHMQCRLGPMEVGPHGALQTIADGLKLIAKEDIIPRLAHRPLFAL
ncbi:MAG: NADH-quinone oxidoreductase subunit H, partial [Planctomycetes bacterium]|nr:NADH-quinone oxidoreductase subunit H [Planctomycetota bacterium]